MNLNDLLPKDGPAVRAVRCLMLIVALISILMPMKVMAECDMERFEKQRQKMVNEQIVARGVSNPSVINAMRVVPRHCFVPCRLHGRAYRDGPQPIGYGQTISQPYIVAVMSEFLDLQPGERVLEIGTGSGYQAAVLSEMGVEVFTIEIVAPLGHLARDLLLSMGYRNIHTKIGDGYRGWPQQAPFDGIIVTCAPSQIPQPLQDQLVESGRMVIPVGSVYSHQQLFQLRKIKGQIKKEKIFDVRFVPMVDEKGKGY